MAAVLHMPENNFYRDPEIGKYTSNTALELPNESKYTTRIQAPNLYINNEISQKYIRRGFIRKVLGIVLIQLLISCIFVIATLLSDNFKEWQEDNIFLVLIASFFELFLIIILICNSKFCRRVPYNYIVLFFFTICVSYLLSYTTARTSPIAVLIATIGTLIIVISMIFVSFFSNYDITIKTTVILYIPMAGIILALFFSLWPYYGTRIIVSLIFVGIFAIFLAYDLQRVSGRFGDEYSIDDYVIAALMIYVDIIIMFKCILQIFGGNN